MLPSVIATVNDEMSQRDTSWAYLPVKQVSSVRSDRNLNVIVLKPMLRSLQLFMHHLPNSADDLCYCGTLFLNNEKNNKKLSYRRETAVQGLFLLLL